VKKGTVGPSGYRGRGLAGRRTETDYSQLGHGLGVRLLNRLMKEHYE
jgi:hypothetical protein